MSAAWTEWPAPAKLNLFLRIVGRRADGYHRLQTVFQLLDWGDRIHLRTRSDGLVRREAGDYPVDEADDLVVRAAKILQTESKTSKGVDIRVEKSIPMGGGFGGGSSDAATVLVALNRLWEAGLDSDQLAALGLALGADVPVFVRGHSAWAEGVGEALSALTLPSIWYLLVDSGVGVPTAQLFQAPDLTRDAAPTTIADFVSDPRTLGPVWGNAFEPVLRRLEPRIAATLDVLAQLGPACLTGTGGGCFVAFPDRDSALQAQRSLPGGLRSWVVAGVNESPLLAALARWQG
ncbi:MAG TPA: 4-(cytidine 5'-diphospho)-2-C-methyl-D-erythritol kinase [Arenimonas sp.]|nr:4-(cytidine 5'-diphospho)-2-C-methyl-D-erythritol kinase [Arenimonas sp.]